MGTLHQVLGVLFSTIHWGLATQSLNKETKGTVDSFRSGIHIVKKSTKAYIFTARCEHFSTGPEIDKKVADGFFMQRKLETNILRFIS